MRTLVLVAVALATGCLPHDDLVSCPNDVLCPVGSVCDTVHGGCVSPDQTTACIGIADRAPCTAGAVFGYCLDEICIDPGCGNLVVDPGELCDDGNRADNDGCSASCLSREACGDGVLDLGLAEQCDDGNLLSHDGCDSKCLTESMVWSYDPLGPATVAAYQMTYDATRGKVVVVRDGYVWAWDGVRWTVLATDAPDLGSAYNVVFDGSSGKLFVIFAEPASGDILLPDPPRSIVYDWDGTTWTKTVTTSAPYAQTMVMTFDAVNKNIFAFGVTTGNTAVVAVLDPMLKKWASVPSPAPVAGMNTASIAYDSGRARVVVGIPGTSFPPAHGHAVLEWTGAVWTASTVPMSVPAAWSLMYDPILQRTLAIGGETSAGTSAVQAWNGVAWSNLPAIPGVRVTPQVAFDVARQKRFAFGGQADEQDDVVEGDQLSWARIERVVPPRTVTDCAYEEPRGRLVCTGEPSFGAGGDIWVWSGTWSRLPIPFRDAAPNALAYDPIRRAIIGIGIAGLLQLTGDTWVPIADGPSISEPATSLVFDPERAMLVGLTAPQFGGTPRLLFIHPDNTVQVTPTPYLTGFAYDARNRVVVASGVQGSTVELVNTTWIPVVGPGVGFRAVTSDRRGTVEFLAPGQTGIERIGTTYARLGTAPPLPITGSVSISQTTGELLVYGMDGLSRFLLHRSWVSATPFERCVAGADDDGDGLAYCDDPDCWPICAPACPPFASCP